MNVSCTLTGPSSLADQDGGIFVKKSARLMITDDLHVISPLSAATWSLITKLGVVNENSKIEQLTFKVGVNEVIDVRCVPFFFVTPVVLWFLTRCLLLGYGTASELFSIKDTFD